MLATAPESEQLDALARADEFGVVKQVQEYFGDYYAVNNELFTLCASNSLSLLRPSSTWTDVDRWTFERCVSGVMSCLLSRKVKPYIRYQGKSECARVCTRARRIVWCCQRVVVLGSCGRC